MNLEVVATALSDVGCLRTVNEDRTCLVQQHDEPTHTDRGTLLVVADGMGGHLAGEVASTLAVDTVQQAYYQTPGTPGEALRHAFTEANRTIHERSASDDTLTGMGTTGTALALCGNQAFNANVGDSRTYLVRDGAIYRMTTDDSAVGELVTRGLLSAADAKHHADRNVILRALGTRPEVAVSCWERPFPVRADDRFVLCSDGLHDMVEDEEIRDVVTTAQPERACQRLIELARARGAPDNISVIVAHVVARTTPAAVPDTRELQVAAGGVGEPVAAAEPLSL